MTSLPNPPLHDLLALTIKHFTNDRFDIATKNRTRRDYDDEGLA
jgi:hypothetical protein